MSSSISIHGIQNWNPIQRTYKRKARCNFSRLGSLIHKWVRQVDRQTDTIFYFWFHISRSETYAKDTKNSFILKKNHKNSPHIIYLYVNIQNQTFTFLNDARVIFFLIKSYSFTVCYNVRSVTCLRIPSKFDKTV